VNELLLGLADDELIIGWRDSEWTGIAPMLEEDVAFSSIAQNEIGHARAVYELLSDDADALAFEDTPAGIASAKGAGLRCCAIATTVPRERLGDADLVADALTPQLVESLLP